MGKVLLFLSRTLFIIPSPPILVPHAVAFIQHHFSFLFQFFAKWKGYIKHTYISNLKPEWQKNPELMKKTSSRRDGTAAGLWSLSPLYGSCHVMVRGRHVVPPAHRTACMLYHLQPSHRHNRSPKLSWWLLPIPNAKYLISKKMR